MSYNIVIGDRARDKDLPKLDHPIKLRVFEEIQSKLSTHPLKFGKPLKNILKGHRTLRVGDYRVLYLVMKDTVYITTIKHRKDSYD